MITINVSRHLDKLESPLWQFDSKSGRYRDTASGRFLSKQNLDRLQQRHIQLIEHDIATIGELLLKGQLSLAGWQEATAKALKTLHLAQMALGRGGVNQATSADYLAVGRTLQKQYGWLKDFARDINRGYSIGDNGQQIPMTVARFQARLSLYAKAGKISFGIGQQALAKSQGKYLVQRFINSAHPCTDCPRYAAMGVQLIGALPLPGEDCECGSNCRCTVRFYASAKETIVAH